MVAPHAMMPNNLLAVQHLTKHHSLDRGPLRRLLPGRQRRVLRAVDGVSFTMAPTETLGLVGESGCGKTTTGRLILRAIEPTSGCILFNGQAITALHGKALQPLRRQAQIVFQDPYASLNPRLTVAQIIGEPMCVHGLASKETLYDEVNAVLEMVGLSPEHAKRYPHELSGGQRQRVGIARAIAVSPEIVILDEPTSSLDVSIRGQILDLLLDLQQRLNLAYLFITHDLQVVQHVADRVAVMYLGGIVETGPTAPLFADPRHPYTRALLSAAPVARWGAKRTRTRLSGEISSAIDPPDGCRLAARCPFALPSCSTTRPPLIDIGDGRAVACPVVIERTSPC